MEERRLKYTRVQQRTVEVEMGMSDGGLDQLSGSQGDESNEGACIFHSGTSSHAGLAQRERKLIMRG